MRTRTLGYGCFGLPSQYGIWIMSANWPFIFAWGWLPLIWKLFCESTRKWIWWKWNSWFSVARFSMIQSSTWPCVVTIAGGKVGSNMTGVAPSTVIKKFVGLAGSLGSEMTSEKYSLRVVFTAAVARPSNR